MKVKPVSVELTGKKERGKEGEGTKNVTCDDVIGRLELA